MTTRTKTGDYSPEHRTQCLARQVATWNLSYQQKFLVKWKKKHGDESYNELRELVADERDALIAQKARDQQAAREALDELRGMTA